MLKKCENPLHCSAKDSHIFSTKNNSVFVTLADICLTNLCLNDVKLTMLCTTGSRMSVSSVEALPWGTSSPNEKEVSAFTIDFDFKRLGFPRLFQKNWT